MEPSSNELTLEELQQIDRVGDDFTRQLETDPRTAFDEFLHRVPEHVRDSLRAELVRRHVRFRHRNGEQPGPQDYAGLLPPEDLRRIVTHDALDAGDSVGTCDPTIAWKERDARGRVVYRPGQSVGRYRLEERLGRGGFGEVWRAWDPELEQPVAVKLVHTSPSASADVVEAFQREARRQAELRDVPGIVRVYDVGKVDGDGFIVSQLAAGGTLAQRLPDLSRDQRLRIVAQVARILHRAHQRHLVHRDVKPSNVLLDDHDQPLLADFGIAATEREMLDEPEHSIVGTWAYMPPEHVAGTSSRATPQADVYGLGVLLYEALADRKPFQADDRQTLRRMIREREPWPLRSIDPAIPQAVERVCLQCLAKDPADRYSSAADVAAELERATGRSTRRRWIAAAVGGTAAAAVATAVYFGRGNDDDAAPNEPANENDPADEDDRLHVRPFTFGREDAVTWDVTDNGRGLRVVSESLALLALGRHAGGRLDLALQFKLLSPVGFAGLFFGLDEDRYPGEVSFDTLEIYAQQSRYLEMRASRQRLPDGDPAGLQSSHLGEETLPLRDWNTHRLTVRIEDDELRRATIGDRELASLLGQRADSLSGRGLPDACLGTFGLVCLGCSCTVSALTIAGRPVNLAETTPD